jgi:hypothetical protein
VCQYHGAICVYSKTPVAGDASVSRWSTERFVILKVTVMISSHRYKVLVTWDRRAGGLKSRCSGVVVWTCARSTCPADASRQQWHNRHFTHKETFIYQLNVCLYIIIIMIIIVDEFLDRVVCFCLQLNVIHQTFWLFPSSVSFTMDGIVEFS